MVYDYHCPKCEKHFEVIKRVSQYDSEELCSCGTVAKKIPAPARVYFSGTKVQEAEYNPGLGCVVRNKEHRKELCKIKGLEEIGNEKPETIHKHFDKEREERRERIYDEAIKGWVGN